MKQNNKTVLDTVLEASQKEIESTFLKQWTPEQFIAVRKAINKHFIDTGISVNKTRHIIHDFRNNERTFEAVGNVLGLAYTSSSKFAGYWVCNCEASNDKYPGYHYIGFALSSDKKVYAILWDKDENQVLINL